jgi:ABC-type glutathione transport system ATPase component
LLIADEPLAHLDPAARVELIDLLASLGRRRGLALLLVSHDLDAVAAACERLVVMEAGRIVESGPTAQVLRHPVSAAARDLTGGDGAPCQPGK